MTDKTDELVQVNAPLPLMPCDRCMNDSEAVSISERLVADYCPHNLSGLARGQRIGLVRAVRRPSRVLDSANLAIFG